MSMRFELTVKDLEEIACCIVDCGLDRDEASDYAIQAASEATAARVEDGEIEC